MRSSALRIRAGALALQTSGSLSGACTIINLTPPLGLDVMSEKSPRVFISYAQQGEAHSAWVRALADQLTRDGIAVVIDQREQWPEKGWRRWMSEQIATADWVLVVCTAAYRQRFGDNVVGPLQEGRGVRWESQHITQELYDARFRNRRFVPVLPPTAQQEDIPLPLQDYRTFRPGETFRIREDDDDHDGYTALYRLLTDQPAYPAPAPGSIRRLRPLADAEAQWQGGLDHEADSPSTANRPNPYPGLVAFTPDRQRFFFGRDEDIPRVVGRLADAQFVCVIGASGTGKSSLIAAGVEPALRRQHPGLSYLRLTPKRDPLAQLAEALDRLLPDERLAFDESDRRARIAEAMASAPAAAVGEYFSQLPHPVLVFVDQFEELFTQAGEDGRAGFKPVFDTLVAAEGLMLVLTLRSEFYARLAEWLRHPALETRLVNLEPIRD